MKDINLKRFKELAKKVKKWKHPLHSEGATAWTHLELTTNFIVWSSVEIFLCGNAFLDFGVELQFQTFKLINAYLLYIPQ